jgi:hypothetical protein
LAAAHDCLLDRSEIDLIQKSISVRPVSPTGFGTPRITQHAVQRWRERVDPYITADQARQELREFISNARHRPRPRHWTDVQPTSNLGFLYWSLRPDVCGLVVDGAVVTVLARRRSRRQSLRDLRTGTHLVSEPQITANSLA